MTVTALKEEVVRSQNAVVMQYDCGYLQRRLRWWGTGGSSTSGHGSRRRSTAAHAGTSVLVLNTAVLGPVGGSSDVVGSSRVHTKGNPSKDTLRNVITKQNVLDNWVIAIRLALKDGVLGVGGELLGVASVGLRGFNQSDQVLIEEHLADVGDGTTRESVVGVESGVQVGHDVDVVGAASVVSGHKSVEGNNTGRVRGLHTSHEGVVEIALIGSVTVAACYDTGVNTSGVAVPDLKVCLRYRLAGVDVDDLDVQSQWHTLLALGDLRSDQFSRDPVRSLGGLRGKNAGVVASEEDGRVSVRGDARQVALVVGVEHLLGIASAKVWLLLADGSLLAQRLDLGGAASMHGNIVATSLESIRAVRKRPLVSAQVGIALSNLLSMLLATLSRVGNGLLSEESSSKDSGELHDAGCVIETDEENGQLAKEEWKIR